MPELMKGHVYHERKHTVRFPVIAEIKYDEIRCHVKVADQGLPTEIMMFLSYAGKPLHNLHYWAPEFTRLMREFKITELDIGILVNKNFNDSYRWCRSSSGIPAEKLDKATGKISPALRTDMVEFLLFDLPNGEGPYSQRIGVLAAIALAANAIGLRMGRPEARVCEDEDALNQYFTGARERGLEGLMVKSMEHGYLKGKRTDGWLKMKPEESFDGKIIGINRAESIEGVPLDRAGSVDVEMEDGSMASPAGIPHVLGADMWQRPEAYIGRWVEFKCMERDRAGGYRHPSLTRFREAKV